MIGAHGVASRQEGGDEEAAAFHEAAYAVTTWTLRFDLPMVTVETPAMRPGHAAHGGQRLPPPDCNAARRGRIEQEVLSLLAADVATRLIRPDIGDLKSEDHDRAHELLDELEQRGAVQIAWCEYLWQRAYVLATGPGQWALIAGLAQQLLKHRALHGVTAEKYLKSAHEAVKCEPPRGNDVPAGEAESVCCRFITTGTRNSGIRLFQQRRRIRRRASPTCLRKSGYSRSPKF